MTDRLRGTTGILGGTFDPIHHAHLAVAELARETLDLRRVVFVPAAQPPHKPGRQITAADHRLAMVEAAIAGNRWFEVSRIELDRDGPSFTVDTLSALRERSPDERLALIVSADAYAEFSTWHEPARILELADLIVATRDGWTEPDPQLLPRQFPQSGAALAFLDGPRIRLSASDIRKLAAAGRSVRYLVPDAVAAYIGDHGLYQDQRRTDRS